MKQFVAEAEDILRPNARKFVTFPIVHKDVWRMYKETISQIWMPEDIDFSMDRKDWLTLSTGEQTFMSMILAFFAAADGIVMENINCNFAQEVQIPEARAYYSYQGAIEQIHAETYSLMIDAVISDSVEKDRLFNAITQISCVQELSSWALKWMNPLTQPFNVRIVAFTIYERLVFQNKFAAIFWMKKRNKLAGICHANLLISRDEASHADHGILLHSKLTQKCPPEIILAMIQEVLVYDNAFMFEALNVELIGMNRQLMLDYTHSVADCLLVQLGCAAHYHTNRNMINDMMDSIGMPNHVNFFEHRNHVYQQSNVIAGQAKGDQFSFSTSKDF